MVDYFKHKGQLIKMACKGCKFIDVPPAENIEEAEKKAIAMLESGEEKPKIDGIVEDELANAD